MSLARTVLLTAPCVLPKRGTQTSVLRCARLHHHELCVAMPSSLAPPCMMVAGARHPWRRIRRDPPAAALAAGGVNRARRTLRACLLLVCLVVAIGVLLEAGCLKKLFTDERRAVVPSLSRCPKTDVVERVGRVGARGACSSAKREVSRQRAWRHTKHSCLDLCCLSALLLGAVRRHEAHQASRCQRPREPRLWGEKDSRAENVKKDRAGCASCWGRSFAPRGGAAPSNNIAG